MRANLLFLLCLGLAAGRSAWAEPLPAVDLAAGYSLLPADGNDFPRSTSHGVQADIAVNLTPSFGIAAGFASQWSTARDLGSNFAGLVAKTAVRQFLVGPRFTARGDRATVFGHGWFGWCAGDAGPGFEGFSDSAAAFGGGGGVDLRLTRRLALRAQYDLIGTFTDIVEGNSRAGLGLVVGIGRR